MNGASAFRRRNAGKKLRRLHIERTEPCKPAQRWGAKGRPGEHGPAPGNPARGAPRWGPGAAAGLAQLAGRAWPIPRRAGVSQACALSRLPSAGARTGPSSLQSCSKTPAHSPAACRVQRRTGGPSTRSGQTHSRACCGATSCCSTRTPRRSRWCACCRGARRLPGVLSALVCATEGPRASACTSHAASARLPLKSPSHETPPAVQFDQKARRTFLRRTLCTTVTADQLYPGNTVLVYARQLTIKDFADAFTRKQLEHQLERSAPCLPCAQLPCLPWQLGLCGMHWSQGGRQPEPSVWCTAEWRCGLAGRASCCCRRRWQTWVCASS